MFPQIFFLDHMDFENFLHNKFECFLGYSMKLWSFWGHLMKANVPNISMDCYSQFEIGSDYSPQLILIYMSSLFYSLNVVKHVRSLYLGLSFPFVLLAESCFGRTSDCFAFSIICIIYYGRICIKIFAYNCNFPVI